MMMILLSNIHSKKDSARQQQNFSISQLFLKTFGAAYEK
jgi:hypothetical protein